MGFLPGRYDNRRGGFKMNYKFKLICAYLVIQLTISLFTVSYVKALSATQVYSFVGQGATKIVRVGTQKGVKLAATVGARGSIATLGATVNPAVSALVVAYGVYEGYRIYKDLFDGENVDDHADVGQFKAVGDNLVVTDWDANAPEFPPLNFTCPHWTPPITGKTHSGDTHGGWFTGTKFGLAASTRAYNAAKALFDAFNAQSSYQCFNPVQVGQSSGITLDDGQKYGYWYVTVDYTPPSPDQRTHYFFFYTQFDFSADRDVSNYDFESRILDDINSTSATERDAVIVDGMVEAQEDFNRIREGLEPIVYKTPEQKGALDQLEDAVKTAPEVQTWADGLADLSGDLIPETPVEVDPSELPTARAPSAEEIGNAVKNALKPHFDTNTWAITEGFDAMNTNFKEFNTNFSQIKQGIENLPDAITDKVNSQADNTAVPSDLVFDPTVEAVEKTDLEGWLGQAFTRIQNTALLQRLNVSFTASGGSQYNSSFVLQGQTLPINIDFGWMEQFLNMIGNVMLGLVAIRQTWNLFK